MSLLFLLFKRKIKEASKSRASRRKQGRDLRREGMKARERVTFLLGVGCFRSCRTQIKRN